MAYCTINDLASRFGQDELIHLTDKKRTGRMDEQAVRTAITDATDTINAYIGHAPDFKRLSELPVMKVKACDIARYYLHTTNVPEVVEKRYEQALVFLKGFMPEGVLLTDSNGGGTPVGVSGKRAFTMESMQAF